MPLEREAIGTAEERVGGAFVAAVQRTAGAQGLAVHGGVGRAGVGGRRAEAAVGIERDRWGQVEGSVGSRG